MKKRAKAKRPTKDQQRIAELEKAVAELRLQLVDAMSRIPNFNRPHIPGNCPGIIHHPLVFC